MRNYEVKWWSRFHASFFFTFLKEDKDVFGHTASEIRTPRPQRCNTWRVRVRIARNGFILTGFLVELCSYVTLIHMFQTPFELSESRGKIRRRHGSPTLTWKYCRFKSPHLLSHWLPLFVGSVYGDSKITRPWKPTATANSVAFTLSEIALSDTPEKPAGVSVQSEATRCFNRKSDENNWDRDPISCHGVG